MELKKIITSTFIWTIIGALPLASGFFLLPFYLNYLSLGDYGLLALYISFTGFVQIVINYGLDTYIGMSYFDNKHDEILLKNHVGTIVGYLLILGVATICLISAFGNRIFDVVFGGDKGMVFYPYGFMCVLTAFFNSIFRTYCNLLVNQQRVMMFMWVSLANFAMTIAFSLSGILLYPYTLVGPMWGRLLSGIGIFLIAIILFYKESNIQFKSGKAMKAAFDFSIPVLLYALLVWLISNGDRYIINFFMTKEDIAIFDFAVKCTLLIEFMLRGFGSMMMPKVYEMMTNQRLTSTTPELNKYFSSYTAVTLLAIPLITLTIPLLLPIIVFKPAYNQSFLFLSILSISFVFTGLSGYFQAPIYFFKKTKLLPKIYVFSAIFQLIITVFLIKYQGLWGAVFASLITKIIQNIFLYLEAKKLFTYTFNVTKFVVLPMVVIVFIVISDTFLSLKNIHWIHLSQLVFTTLLVTLIYRRELLGFVYQFILKRRHL
jgi:O-antigen/teichoic acid export membrane protein